MTQNFESPSELHADHRHWNIEISLWKDEIDVWKKQLSTALRDLEQMSELIRDHDNALDCHIKDLESIESGIQYHEKNLAKSLCGNSDFAFDNALLERHSVEAKKIAFQRNAHEGIKKHQHIAMAHVAVLKTALERAL